MACEAAREGKAASNLGVMSFSPVIYHRKIKAAAEKLGLRQTEVYIFLDLSDIMDDAIVYHEANDGSVEMTTSYHWFDTGQFLLGNFATFRLWAASRGVRFVDGFAPFFQEQPDVALRKYFIQGDAHFTPQGHRLLFEELRRSNSPF